MLSRRNVRVKVMQLLYARRQDEALGDAGARRAFRTMIDQSYATLLSDLATFCRILLESREEQRRRRKRLRPSAEDKAFRSRLYDNPLVLALAGAPELRRAAERYGFADLTDEERIRGFYKVAAATDPAQVLATAEEGDEALALQALLSAHKALIDEEDYDDYLEDRFSRWQEDKSLVVGAVKKILKALPQSAAVLSTYRPDDATVEGFGDALLDYVLSHDAELMRHIEPVLLNWDAERLATLDLVLLKMALGELLIFPQIPPKVTLNEYVELAKSYSTEKSREFVNGVLDRLLHTLRDEGLIVKEGRGLVE